MEKRLLSARGSLALSALCALVSVLSGCASAGPARAPAAFRAPVQDRLEIDEANRRAGYQLIHGGADVAFILDAGKAGGGDISEAYVEGSFNGWSKGSDEAWLMTELPDGRTWVLSKRAAEVRVPGNSGFPEFKFYLRLASGGTSEPNAPEDRAGFRMAGNNLVFFPGDDPAYVAANLPLVSTAKRLADFDLSDPAQVALLTNFRLVPGTAALYRGYHPYKLSRSQFDTEAARSELLKKEIEAAGVRSIVTLSGKEEPTGEESLGPYLQSIRDGGDWLFLNTSYNVVYYQSDGEDFGKLIQGVVRFIDSHPGPYYVHCRLGTDRTGCVSAVLAALCGASWADIAADYQKSNLTGIKEFRDCRLLEYSFSRMLGQDPATLPNLAAALAGRFSDSGYLSAAEIAALRERLGSAAH